MNKRKRNMGKYAVYCGTLLLIAALNMAAWNSTDFSDWYIAHIFPLWVNTYGRITGLVPFSVGEWMLGAGTVLIVMAIVLGLVWAGIGISMGFRAVFGRDVMKEKIGRAHV